MALPPFQIALRLPSSRRENRPLLTAIASLMINRSNENLISFYL